MEDKPCHECEHQTSDDMVKIDNQNYLSLAQIAGIKNSWFKRHINWTFVLFILIAFVALAIFLGIFCIVTGRDAGHPPVPLAILVFMAAFASLTSTGSWLLFEKSRSPWWILFIILWAPIGIIVLLALKNKNMQIAKSNSIIGKTVFWSVFGFWGLIALIQFFELYFGSFILALIFGIVFAVVFYGFAILVQFPRHKQVVLYISFSIVESLFFIFLIASKNIYAIDYYKFDILFNSDVCDVIGSTALVSIIPSAIIAGIIYGIYKLTNKSAKNDSNPA